MQQAVLSCGIGYYATQDGCELSFESVDKPQHVNIQMRVTVYYAVQSKMVESLEATKEYLYNDITTNTEKSKPTLISHCTLLISANLISRL